MNGDTFDSNEYDGETEGSDDYRVSPQDFASIFVIPSDWTVSTLRSEMNEIVDLDPAFQRRSVWSLPAKSKFIESLILGIPIPQILMAESRDRRNHYLVLDGKQRLLTIKEFFEGSLIDGKPFALTGLDDLPHLNGKRWQDIQRDFLPEARSIEGAQIRTAIIRGWSNDNILYEIFHRLNSGSVRLSPMELRMALIRGPFIASVIRETVNSSAFFSLLNLNSPDKRMRDVDIAIRHMAFSDERMTYRGNLKEFLDTYCRLRNNDFIQDGENLSDLYNLDEAINAGLNIFGKGEFSRRYIVKDGKFDSRFNRAAFDVLAGSLAFSSMRKKALMDKARFVDAWKEACGDGDFLKAIETTTKSIDATAVRFNKWYSMLNDAFNETLKTPKIGDD